MRPKPVDVWRKKPGSKSNDISLSLNPGQKTPELPSLVSQRALPTLLPYLPFLPISVLQVPSHHIPRHLRSWLPPPFLQDSILGISSQVVLFPSYLLIQFRTPTISRQMQVLGDREHPAWTAYTTPLSLLPSDRVPILTSSGQENLDHLTPSRYVSTFS